MKIVKSPAVNVPISAAIETGDLVFLSGQIAFREGKIAGETVAEQTEVVIDALEGVLAELGLTLDNVVKTSVWLTDASLFGEFNGVYAERFKAPCPARSTVISGLALPGALVEIDAIASRTSQRG
ncbi:RidA family protein [Sphingobium boeckii]|nr:RidA family protein [Sphingobium boeckii]